MIPRKQRGMKGSDPFRLYLRREGGGYFLLSASGGE
jgi:hypothetical protein